MHNIVDAQKTKLTGHLCWDIIGLNIQPPLSGGLRRDLGGHRFTSAFRAQAGSVADTLAAVFLHREERHRVNWINAWWQEISATVANGLQITVVGMALVFLTLGLIILALILLTRLPGLSQAPKKEQDVVPNAPPDRSAAGTAVGSAPTETELAQVAAIAVALLRSRRTRPPRSRARSVTSRWKQYGRAHQLGL